jgi:murein DD-endopeptidase MepM/ murein hydrolase activator NlpD
MITLTTEQAQQIEEALVEYRDTQMIKAPRKALSIIRAARAQEQAEQEPVMDYERLNALREGEQNGAEDAYFFVRPENDTPTLRKMFCQGFERGFHKGIKYAAPVSIESAVLAEREACAKLCEPVEGYAYEVGVYKTMQTLAAAIRVRSEQ